MPDEVERTEGYRARAASAESAPLAQAVAVLERLSKVLDELGPPVMEP